MATTRGLLVIERILRDRAGIWQQIRDERDLRELISQMLFSSVIALACYGVVLGVSNGALQAISSAVKLPLLFLVTLAICLPTLYLFNLVFGARLSIRQALTLVLVAITVTSMLSLAFAPISLFFVVTAPDYAFYKLLNVAIMTLTGFVGVSVLIDGMRGLNRLDAAAQRAEEAARPEAAQSADQASDQTAGTSTEKPDAGAAEKPAASPNGAATAPATAPATVAATSAQPAATAVADPPHPMAYPHPGPYGYARPAARPQPQPKAEPSGSMGLLYVWAGLFGLVGTQLAWTLRPFFGSPGEPFEIVRKVEGNFYVDIIRTLGQLF